jgi:DNA-binding NtrC family response regulator
MRALLVEDDATMRGLLRSALQAAGGEELEVLEAGTAAAAVELAEAPELLDLCLLDLGLPRHEADEAARKVDPRAGVAVLEALEARRDAPRVVVVSGHERDLVLRLLLGRRVHDFLAKGAELGEVEGRLGAQLDVARERRAARAARSALGRADAGEVVGRAPALRDVLDRARKAAEVDAAVLVTGESGTGKEGLAQLVHRGSPRAGGPFVVVDCATLSENLIESELFGHRRGAFTGADADRAGRFELADGGTIFLDEIGELPLSLQPRLLRVLQEFTVERLGEATPRRVDVRVVAATNRDLLAEVAAGRFREDLYYRLAVVTVELPPLRQRPGDVALLTEHFLEVLGRRLGKRLEGVEPDAMALLEAAPWPGNIRQLRNALEAGMILESGPRLTREALAGLVPGAAPSGDDPPVAMDQAHAEALLAWRRPGGARRRPPTPPGSPPGPCATASRRAGCGPARAKHLERLVDGSQAPLGEHRSPHRLLLGPGARRLLSQGLGVREAGGRGGVPGDQRPEGGDPHVRDLQVALCECRQGRLAQGLHPLLQSGAQAALRSAQGDVGTAQLPGIGACLGLAQAFLGLGEGGAPLRREGLLGRLEGCHEPLDQAELGLDGVGQGLASGRGRSAGYGGLGVEGSGGAQDQGEGSEGEARHRVSFRSMSRDAGGVPARAGLGSGLCGSGCPGFEGATGRVVGSPVEPPRRRELAAGGSEFPP